MQVIRRDFFYQNRSGDSCALTLTLTFIFLLPLLVSLHHFIFKHRHLGVIWVFIMNLSGIRSIYHGSFIYDSVPGDKSLKLLLRKASVIALCLQSIPQLVIKISFILQEGELDTQHNSTTRTKLLKIVGLTADDRFDNVWTILLLLLQTLGWINIIKDAAKQAKRNYPALLQSTKKRVPLVALAVTSRIFVWSVVSACHGWLAFPVFLLPLICQVAWIFWLRKGSKDWDSLFESLTANFLPSFASLDPSKDNAIYSGCTMLIHALASSLFFFALDKQELLSYDYVVQESILIAAIVCLAMTEVYSFVVLVKDKRK